MLKKRSIFSLIATVAIFASVVGAGSTNADNQTTANNNAEDPTAMVEEYFRETTGNPKAEMDSYDSLVKIDRVAMVSEGSRNMLGVTAVQIPENTDIIFVVNNHIMEVEEFEGEIVTPDDYSVVKTEYLENHRGSWVLANKNGKEAYLIQDDTSDWYNDTVYAYNHESGCITKVKQPDPATLQ